MFRRLHLHHLENFSKVFGRFWVFSVCEGSLFSLLVRVVSWVYDHVPFSSPALRSLHGRPVVLDLWIYQSYLPHSPLSPHANDEMNASIMAMLAWLDRARHWGLRPPARAGASQLQAPQYECELWAYVNMLVGCSILVFSFLLFVPLPYFPYLFFPFFPIIFSLFSFFLLFSLFSPLFPSFPFFFSSLFSLFFLFSFSFFLFLFLSFSFFFSFSFSITSYEKLAFFSDPNGPFCRWSV